MVEDGTFDDTLAMSRLVVVNGIMACNIPAALIPLMRDGKGNSAEMSPFGHFPDLPRPVTPSLVWRCIIRREDLCQRKTGLNGEPCGLVPPCPDCGPGCHDVPAGA
jgi:hypothetical protein